jgi:hypothetical protein
MIKKMAKIAMITIRIIRAVNKIFDTPFIEYIDNLPPKNSNT